MGNINKSLGRCYKSLADLWKKASAIKLHI